MVSLTDGIRSLIAGAAQSLGLGAGPGPPDEAAPPPDPVAIAKYFLALKDTGEIWPEKEWDDARQRYEGEEDPKRRPTTNRFSMGVDTSMAYLDEQPGKIVCQPEVGFKEDPQAMGEARCDGVLLPQIYDRMGFRETLKRWGQGAGITGLAWLAYRMDLRRMLPDLMLVENEDVRVDGECKGDLRRAQWLAYLDPVTPEDLVRERPDLDLLKLKKAAGSPPESANAAGLQGEALGRRRDALKNVGDTLKKCARWRIYCRGSVALYDVEPVVTDLPHTERYRDRKGMNEPRRYVEVVEGYDGTIVDEPAWPEALALDFDEWPLERLAFKEAFRRVSGVSDYRHEQVVLDMYEDSVNGAAHWAILMYYIRFALGPGCKLTDEELKAILRDKNRLIVPGALDAAGNPAMKKLDLGTLEQAMLEWPEALKEIHSELRGEPRIKMADTDNDPTATATRIAADAASMRSDVRLGVWERGLEAVAWRVLMMAHANLRQFSTLEVAVQQEGPPGEDGLPTAVTLWQPKIDVPWPEAEMLLSQKDGAGKATAELVALGVDALVGQAHAAAWVNEQPMEVVRNRRTVSVEAGSTQKHQRQQRIATFIQTFTTFIAPVIQATGDWASWIEAARKVLSMQDLEEFESILPQAPPPMAMGMPMAAGPAGTGLPPVSAAAPTTGGPLVSPPPATTGAPLVSPPAPVTAGVPA